MWFSFSPSRAAADAHFFGEECSQATPSWGHSHILLESLLLLKGIRVSVTIHRTAIASGPQDNQKKTIQTTPEVRFCPLLYSLLLRVSNSSLRRCIHDIEVASGEGHLICLATTGRVLSKPSMTYGPIHLSGVHAHKFRERG
jgi:hypothetical protein